MKRKAQSTIEYVVTFSIVLASILAIGMIGRIRGALELYFDAAAYNLTGTVPEDMYGANKAVNDEPVFVNEINEATDDQTDWALHNVQHAL